MIKFQIGTADSFRELYQGKSIGLVIVFLYSHISTHTELTGWAYRQVGNPATYYRSSLFGLIFYDMEFVPVKSIEPVPCSKPHKAIMILDTTCHVIIA